MKELLKTIGITILLGIGIIEMVFISILLDAVFGVL